MSIAGEILFQDTWCRGIDWDEILPYDIAGKWHFWSSTLDEMSNITVPRWIGLANQTPETSQIHVFCDAPERAYGAVLYCRIQDNDDISVRLICSKNGLSPIKKVTLPRLELLAALMGSRLLKYFCNSTGCDMT